MTYDEKLQRYLQIMSLIKEMRRQGILSDPDVKAASRQLTEKYGLSEKSLFVT